ncbi:MAG TPA: hypothetical protein VEX70_03760 [Pyrinomonadaceae bacterium]|nr:hypothetical protein [Pyrinomonadaceae bacterium]
MKLPARLFLSLAIYSLAAVALVASSACTTADNTNGGSTTATTNVTPPPAGSPSPLNLTVTERPQKIKDQMQARGEQDAAAPTLRFVEPREGAILTGSTVNVKLALAGDLKGYKPSKDPATNMGNHIHVILDNQPYEAYYNLDESFELRNVTEGKHTLRVFASRPWHESYKNDGSFQMVSFTVRGGGGDASKPTTTASGQTMADNKNTGANANASNANAAAPPREGKEMASSQAGEIDRAKPLLTYSRPKGDYKGADAEAIMIDFWLTNAKLQGDGGDYRVRYTVNGGEPKFIDKWEPIWLTGWTNGKHTVKIELVDRDGNVVENGGYNSTSRDINVSK